MCPGFDSGLLPYVKFGDGSRFVSRVFLRVLRFSSHDLQKPASPNSNWTTIEYPHENQLTRKCGFLSEVCKLMPARNIDHITNRNERATPLSNISELLSYINFVRKET